MRRGLATCSLPVCPDPRSGISLRERYERLQSRRGKASVEELLAIAKRASAQVKHPYLDHATFLYDQRGLPK